MNLKSVSSSIKHVGHGVHMNPRRDWLTLLGIAFVLLAVSIAWNLWLFHTATQDRPIGSGTSIEDAKPLDLDPVRSLFTERAAERARYIDSYGFTDPSR